MAPAAILSQPLEQLRVGDHFATSGRTVTEADVVSFSAQTGDFHPLHVDAEWAAATPFGERIAPGVLTLSYALGLVRFDPGVALALTGFSDVVFTRPVRIGDTLSVVGRVASVSPGEAGAGMVTFTLRTLNQLRQLVCRARIQVKWRGDHGEAQPREGTGR